MAESVTEVPQLNNTMGQTKGMALEDGELPMEKTPEKHGDANGTSVSLVSPICKFAFARAHEGRHAMLRLLKGVTLSDFGTLSNCQV
jgi:hypothetical protein